MSYNSENEKLTLREAVRLLGIDCATDRRTVNIPCPICGGSQKKLNINYDLFGPDDGAFRCNKCEIGGRALHFWALYRGLDIYNAKAAAADYNKFMRGNREAKKIKKETKKTTQSFKRIDVDVVDVDTRDRTYRALLDMLILSPVHQKDLTRRGLSKDEIIKNGYKSYPVANRQQIANYLLSNGYVLEGVPGFYVNEKGQWTMRSFPNGYLIPQRDGKNRIQGLQLRLDKGDPKYITLSTAEMNKGAKGRTYCHLAKGWKNSIEDVILTEGPLKADIISKYTGYSVIAIPGVNCTDYLAKAVSDMMNAGMKKVTIAFDMDLYQNVHVKAALEKLTSMLASLECAYTLLDWEQEYKGLDDWLQNFCTKDRDGRK